MLKKSGAELPSEVRHTEKRFPFVTKIREVTFSSWGYLETINLH